MEFELRKLQPADAELLADLAGPYYREVAPQTQIDVAAAVSRHLSDPMRRNWLFMADGEIAGFAFTFPVVPDLWEIAEFSVMSHCRRRGVGALALAHVLARQPGSWRLGVVAKGEGAAAFWAGVLGRLACVSDLKIGPPLMPGQTSSYSFSVSGECHDD